MLKTIKWETAQIEDRSYNDAGMLTGVDRAFVDETRTYNASSQLTQINNTNVGSQTYTYDLNGNVTSESLSGVMANYSFSTIHAGGPFADGYDAEDRFMRFKRSGVTEDILLTRSNIGNISNVNRNGTNTARGYNTSHGLTTVTGGTTQTYDTDGNTTTLHTNVSAAWDDAGRMRNTNVPAGATAGIQGLNENGYVGGNRVWKKITRSGSVVEHRVHIHAGPNLIAEYNAGVAASTPVQEYVYAGEIDSLVLIRRSDATKYGVTRNRQWSITALHDLASGTIVERYAYEMTGKRTIYAANGTTVRTTSSYGNNFGYTNRWHDEDSGLMYFRARYYNPLTGEFLSRDPMEFVDGMSMYRGYFGVVGVDPNGLVRLRSDDLPTVSTANVKTSLFEFDSDWLIWCGWFGYIQDDPWGNVDDDIIVTQKDCEITNIDIHERGSTKMGVESKAHIYASALGEYVDCDGCDEKGECWLVHYTHSLIGANVEFVEEVEVEVGGKSEGGYGASVPVGPGTVSSERSTGINGRVRWKKGWRAIGKGANLRITGRLKVCPGNNGKPRLVWVEPPTMSGQIGKSPDTAVDFGVNPSAADQSNIFIYIDFVDYSPFYQVKQGADGSWTTDYDSAN